MALAGEIRLSQPLPYLLACLSSNSWAAMSSLWLNSQLFSFPHLDLTISPSFFVDRSCSFWRVSRLGRLCSPLILWDAFVPMLSSKRDVLCRGRLADNRREAAGNADPVSYQM